SIEYEVCVRVAEERSCREIAPRVRRLRRLGGKPLLGRLLVERADVGRYILFSDRRGKQTRSDRVGQRGWGDGEQAAPVHARQTGIHVAGTCARDDCDLAPRAFTAAVCSNPNIRGPATSRTRTSTCCRPAQPAPRRWRRRQ